MFMEITYNNKIVFDFNNNWYMISKASIYSYLAQVYLVKSQISKMHFETEQKNE